MNFLVITPLYLNRFCMFTNLLNSTTFQNLFKDLTVSFMCSMIDQFSRQYFTVIQIQKFVWIRIFFLNLEM